MSRGFTVACAFAVLFLACVGDDPDTTGTTPTPSADGGTSTSGGPTGTNLADDGSFENGCGGALYSSNGELTSFTDFGKTGAKACKVCRTPGGEPSLYFYAKVDLKPKAAERYAVSVFVRKVPSVESGGNMQISIGGIDSGETFNEDGALTDGPEAITDEWKEAKVEWTVAKDDASLVRIDLGLPQAADNVCFLVDDLFVSKK